jgi:hypothetical protein
MAQIAKIFNLRINIPRNTILLQPLCFSIKPWESYLFSSRDPGKVAIQPPTPVNRNNLVVITAIMVMLQSIIQRRIFELLTTGKVT